MTKLVLRRKADTILIVKLRGSNAKSLSSCRKRIGVAIGIGTNKVCWMTKWKSSSEGGQWGPVHFSADTGT